jgi:putative FmdB family regulatory protein
MPLYSYRCNTCLHIFEKVLTIADYKVPEQEPCPSCNKEGNVEKVILSAPLYTGGDRIRVDGGFKEVIQKIKATTPHNTLPDY